MSGNKSNPLADKRITGTKVKERVKQPSVRSLRRNVLTPIEPGYINIQTFMISVYRLHKMIKSTSLLHLNWEKGRR